MPIDKINGSDGFQNPNQTQQRNEKLERFLRGLRSNPESPITSAQPETLASNSQERAALLRLEQVREHLDSSQFKSEYLRKNPQLIEDYRILMSNGDIDMQNEAKVCSNLMAKSIEGIKKTARKLRDTMVSDVQISNSDLELLYKNIHEGLFHLSMIEVYVKRDLASKLHAADPQLDEIGQREAAKLLIPREIKECQRAFGYLIEAFDRVSAHTYGEMLMQDADQERKLKPDQQTKIPEDLIRRKYAGALLRAYGYKEWKVKSDQQTQTSEKPKYKYIEEKTPEGKPVEGFTAEEVHNLARQSRKKLSQEGKMTIKEAWEALQSDYQGLSSKLKGWETNRLAFEFRKTRIMKIDRNMDMATLTEIIDKLEKDKNDRRKINIIIAGAEDGGEAFHVHHIVRSAGYKATFLGNKEELYHMWLPTELGDIYGLPPGTNIYPQTLEGVTVTKANIGAEEKSIVTVKLQKAEETQGVNEHRGQLEKELSKKIKASKDYKENLKKKEIQGDYLIRFIKN